MAQVNIVYRRNIALSSPKLNKYKIKDKARIKAKAMLKAKVKALVKIDQEIFSYDSLTPRLAKYYLKKGLVKLYSYGYYILSIRNSSIRIFSLGILPRFQGLGLGTKLLKDIIAIALAKHTKLTLEAKEEAVSFYKKHNFRVVKVLRKYYTDGQDAYRMIYEKKT